MLTVLLLGVPLVTPTVTSYLNQWQHIRIIDKQYPLVSK